MVGAVRPVLHQIGHQDDQEQRDPEVQVGHPAPDAVIGRPAKELVHHQVGGQQHKAHHHVVDQKVVEIGLPLGAEDGLVLAQRKQLLDKDENQRAAQQIEDEPIQTDIGRIGGEAADGHLVATEQRRQQHQAKGRCRQPAHPAEHHQGHGQAACDHHAPKQQLAHDIDVVAAAQLGRGQVLRKMKSQHAQKAQGGQDQCNDAGHHAFTSTQGAMAFRQFVESLKHSCLLTIRTR